MKEKLFFVGKVTTFLIVKQLLMPSIKTELFRIVVLYKPEECSDPYKIE